jgi:dihydropteroate synthase-like protein
MNILVVTGRRAEKTVRKAVGDLAEVIVLDVEIAAFITPRLLKASLPDKNYDLILVPGLAARDFSDLEEEIGVQVRKGPKHAFDLRFVLPYAGEVKFSGRIPACVLLAEKLRREALEVLEELEEKVSPSFMLRGIKIGGASSMKVLAEVVDATILREEELIRRIQYFLGRGADMIDLGVSLDSDRKDIIRAIETAKSCCDAPISIDTLNQDAIQAGVSAGVDLVLSLDSKGIEAIGGYLAEAGVAAVVIPEPRGGLEGLMANLERAREAGINKVIADPVLAPIGQGLALSLVAYYGFRQLDSETPLFFGVGNVTELLDADTVGVNALLAGIAMELQASILFTPEYSDKAKGSVFELKRASQMMVLARHRDTSPKDLGLDLLLLKEKRRRHEEELPRDALEARASRIWTLDPLGCFKIAITRERVEEGIVKGGKIVAMHKRATIVGSTAKEVLDSILGMGLVSRLDHATYLGRELMKAELALKLGRSYAQDDDF